MLHDWELVSTAPWVLQPENGAVVQGDIATLIYSCTNTFNRVVNKVVVDDDGKPVLDADEKRTFTEVEETEDRVETRTAKHYRTSFDGKMQTKTQWYANIRREIAADLSGLNPEKPAELNITADMTR